MSAGPVLLSIDGPIATVTLNRPQARNAISSALLTGLRSAIAAIADHDAVQVGILTGTDPAFCAGLDLKELGGAGSAVQAAVSSEGGSEPWPPVSKPLIAAVNGPAITGGLEFVLNCDVAICSEKAVFADTHARVGILPGWGLSVLLPLAVGRSFARQMSLTGNFVAADRALTAGLVSEVVSHQDLLPRAREIASAIAGNDGPAVRAILASYREIEAELVSGGYAAEQRASNAWRSGNLNLTESSLRRTAVIARGRAQSARGS